MASPNAWTSPSRWSNPATVALERIPSGAPVLLNVSRKNAAAIELYKKFDFSE
jgi:hypothetical protein